MKFYNGYFMWISLDRMSKHIFFLNCMFFFQRIQLKIFFYRRPSGSEASVLVTGLHHIKSVHPDHIGGYALALPIIAGIESKFGLVFPKFRAPPPKTGDNPNPNPG